MKKPEYYDANKKRVQRKLKSGWKPTLSPCQDESDRERLAIRLHVLLDKEKELKAQGVSPEDYLVSDEEIDEWVRNHKSHATWNKGASHSALTRYKIRVARAKQVIAKGWSHTQETRDKISATKRAAKTSSWNKGVSMRAESRQKLSDYYRSLKENDPEAYAAYIERLKQRPKPSGKRLEIMRTARIGTKLTQEHKDAISRAQTGRKGHGTRPVGSAHHMYGKPAPKGSGRGKGGYCRKGHWVRSQWELGIANWLYNRNINYEYEPELFDLGEYNGKPLRYRPDFYLTDFDLYYEVKGYRDELADEKIKRFRGLLKTVHVIDKTWWRQYTNGSDTLPTNFL